jgi:hypothetical protein
MTKSKDLSVEFTDADGGTQRIPTGFVSLYEESVKQRREQQSKSQRARRECERQEKANATK